MNFDEIKIIRSDRKTISLQIHRDGSVTVRAPYKTTEKAIKKFVEEHSAWLDRNSALMDERKKAAENTDKLTEKELAELAEKARKLIPGRCEYFASLIGVKYGRITVRAQTSKWGSCSSKGNLNFNCLLMLAPPDVLDSVVVHELCHLKQMNHSRAFYGEVLKVMPDYYQKYGWLKQHGYELMLRLPEK